MKKLLVKAYKKVFGKSDKIAENYKKKDYLEAYSEHTDARIAEDPHAAIGGHWEEIGTLQFEFLKRQGLIESNSFLDIGCGTLRGGRHFIRFLAPGKYYGVDISSKAIEFANKLVAEEQLEAKRPVLSVNEKKNLKFDEFNGKTFDFLLAQSVFTHLMPEHLEECFANVGKVMNEKSMFYFTYFRSEEYKQINLKDFSYPLSYFQNLASRHGFSLTDHTSDYDHPKSQNMLSIRKK